MIRNCLPLISFPNDTNNSDIFVILSSGEVITASDSLKKFPVMKALLSMKIKLMADNPNATVINPQIMVVTHKGEKYASISFYCSKDNFGRETSSSIVFKEGQENELKLLLDHSEIPPSLKAIKEKIKLLVDNVNFCDEDGNVKKKGVKLTILLVLFAIMALAIILINFARNS